MGLDIYLFNIVKNPTADLIKKSNFDSRSLVENSELIPFKNHTRKKKYSYYNFELVFQNLGLNFEEYEWDSIGRTYDFRRIDAPNDLHLSKETAVIRSANGSIVSKNYVIINEKDMKYNIKFEDTLFFDKIWYQRRCMKSEFYEIAENSKYITEKSRVEFFTQFVDDYSIDNWNAMLDKFVEGETLFYPNW